MLLLQFGLEELGRGSTRIRWLRPVPLTVLAVAATATLAISDAGSVGTSSWLSASEAIARYLLAFPGALLTALALDRVARNWPTLSARSFPYLRGAAISFALYALLTGIVVPPAPFPPASVLNTAPPMDLVALVGRMVEQFRLTNPMHQITLVAKSSKVVGVWDEARLEQVLANLLDNAVKYSPGGGPIEVLVETVDGSVEVAVRDQGVGIPKQAQARLFERFYRVPLGGPRPPGLGLGLYISRQIVLLHGGRMWFESEEGKGSVFHFTLPLPRPPE